MDGMDGRRRAVIEGITPQIDGGRFPVKRVVGETLTVEADAFCDGHDQILCALQYRHAQADGWQEIPMDFLQNDRWRAEFTVSQLGPHRYRVLAWVDHFFTWLHDLERRIQAEDIAIALQVGSGLASAAAGRAGDGDRDRLHQWAALLVDSSPLEERRLRGLSDDFVAIMAKYPDRSFATVSEPELPLTVDRSRARFSAWYEFFPRSCVSDPAGHGTFLDAEARLAYAASMGFDVVYLPPIHPIGITKRKGKNNILTASPDDPGSPWAIGAHTGGHQAVHPQLGTLDDFRRFLAKARSLALDVALDIAFQCSPDHPHVHHHVEWFQQRPDGSIQFAENPPKRYEDIYPFCFEAHAWQSLWEELKRTVLFWAEEGVHIFRVDNPHTKPFALWEWLIAEVKRVYPEALFLAEAFSRPKVMHRLAKLGFTQSYTYFTWRNTKWELTQYMTELTRSDIADYFIPNFWPNTPDILPEYLQFGGRPAFMARLVLAATLSSNYGIYGPAFELYERAPRAPGSEEYLNSEKYEIRPWDLERPDSLRDFVARINQIRQDIPALQHNRSLRFHNIDNDEIIAYSKGETGDENVVVVVVNLDPAHAQSGWLQLPLAQLGLNPMQPYQVHDLLTDDRHLWHGEKNYVRLDPLHTPAHIFLLRRRIRREQDFEYFM